MSDMEERQQEASGTPTGAGAPVDEVAQAQLDMADLIRELLEYF